MDCAAKRGSAPGGGEQGRAVLAATWACRTAVLADTALQSSPKSQHVICLLNLNKVKPNPKQIKRRREGTEGEREFWDGIWCFEMLYFEYGFAQNIFLLERKGLFSTKVNQTHQSCALPMADRLSLLNRNLFSKGIFSQTATHGIFAQSSDKTNNN